MLVCQCGWRCVTGGRRTHVGVSVCGWRCVTGGRTHVSVSVWLEMCDWREEDTC